MLCPQSIPSTFYVNIKRDRERRAGSSGGVYSKLEVTTLQNPLFGEKPSGRVGAFSFGPCRSVLVLFSAPRTMHNAFDIYWRGKERGERKKRKRTQDGRMVLVVVFLPTFTTAYLGRPCCGRERKQEDA